MLDEDAREFAGSLAGRLSHAFRQAVPEGRAGQSRSKRHEAVRLIFAEQPEVSWRRIAAYCEAFKEDFPIVVGVTGSDPKITVPLQVTDFIAYEIGRGWGIDSW